MTTEEHVQLLDSERNYFIELCEQYGHANNCAKTSTLCLNCDCGLQKEIIELIQNRMGA